MDALRAQDPRFYVFAQEIFFSLYLLEASMCIKGGIF